MTIALGDQNHNLFVRFLRQLSSKGSMVAFIKTKQMGLKFNSDQPSNPQVWLGARAIWSEWLMSRLSRAAFWASDAVLAVFNPLLRVPVSRRVPYILLIPSFSGAIRFRGSLYLILYSKFPSLPRSTVVGLCWRKIDRLLAVPYAYYKLAFACSRKTMQDLTLYHTVMPRQEKDARLASHYPDHSNPDTNAATSEDSSRPIFG